MASDELARQIVRLCLRNAYPPLTISTAEVMALIKLFEDEACSGFVDLHEVATSIARGQVCLCWG